MATAVYDTINQQIIGETEDDLIYRNLHTNLKITDMVSGNSIVVPCKQILSKYRYMMEKHVLEITLDDIQYEHYRQNPHALSDAIYGTTQFWAILLELNHCINRYEFNMKTVKFYDPDRIVPLINDILIAEEELK